MQLFPSLILMDLMIDSAVNEIWGCDEEIEGPPLMVYIAWEIDVPFGGFVFSQ